MKFNYITKRKLAALTLSTMVLGSVISFSGCEKEDNKDIYMQIIEENGEESNVLKYLEVSENFNDTNLDKYTFNRNNSIILDNPNDIIAKIDSYKNAKKVNVTNVDYLKNQEALVNEYIYNSGCALATTNITKSVKEYTAELYDLDTKFIEFNCVYEKSSGMNSVYLIYKEDYVYETTKILDENIIKGVVSMTKISSYYDYDISDNSKYNKERNKRIKEALIYSHKLDSINDEKDLYDEKFAKRFKK